ncbi:MAG: hypothetical protein MZV70_05700 [Desulfobacterales bacterium]|nr:hypothetical protein [Desulfobacterales bacterium]
MLTAPGVRLHQHSQQPSAKVSGHDAGVLADEDGCDTIGITVHKMIEKLDSGDILLQRSASIETAASLDSAISKTKREGAKMMVDFLLDFERHFRNPVECDVSEATYFSFPDRASTAKFLATGKKLF